MKDLNILYQNYKDYAAEFDATAPLASVSVTLHSFAFLDCWYSSTQFTSNCAN